MNVFAAIILCVIVISAPFVSDAAKGHASWEEILRGLSYRRLELSTSGHNVTLHALKVDSDRLTIRPVYTGDNSTARKMGERSGAMVLLNANFFDTENRPLGLVVIDKAERHPFKAISWWSLFCLKGKKAAIVRSGDYRPGQCHQAVQAGPRLTVHGGVPPLKEEVSRKTAVGITPRGDVILVVSEGPLPIRELSAVFQRPDGPDGLGCPDAMNLDGGSSSQLYVRAGSFRLNVPSYVRFPVGIGVFER